MNFQQLKKRELHNLSDREIDFMVNEYEKRVGAIRHNKARRSWMRAYHKYMGEQQLRRG